MADEIVQAVSYGAAVWAVGKPMVEKILGPTAEYIGKELATSTEKRVQNLKRIFDRAGSVLGEKVNEPGQVPPKVLKSILSEGSFSDDVISADYFGGVLASSRSGIARDDRGVVYTALIGRMSNYQVRAHYILYSVLAQIIRGRDVNLNMGIERDGLKAFIPFAEFINSMKFEVDEPVWTILEHILTNLKSEQLIGDHYGYGGGADLARIAAKPIDPNEAGLFFVPSSLGLELYMWAHGFGDKSTNDFLQKEIEFILREDVELPVNVRIL